MNSRSKSLSAPHRHHRPDPSRCAPPPVPTWRQRLHLSLPAAFFWHNTLTVHAIHAKRYKSFNFHNLLSILLSVFHHCHCTTLPCWSETKCHMLPCKSKGDFVSSCFVVLLASTSYEQLPLTHRHDNNIQGKHGVNYL